MSDAVHNVSASDYTQAVLQSAVPVVVDFWAPWCGPCRMVAPEMEKLATKMGDKVKVVKVNVDENGTLASSLRIMSIPTILVFEGGKEIARHVGFLPADTLATFLHEKVLVSA